jgi:hypothetical protein
MVKKWSALPWHEGTRSAIQAFPTWRFRWHRTKESTRATKGILEIRVRDKATLGAVADRARAEAAAWAPAARVEAADRAGRLVRVEALAVRAAEAPVDPAAAARAVSVARVGRAAGVPADLVAPVDRVAVAPAGSVEAATVELRATRDHAEAAAEALDRAAWVRVDPVEAPGEVAVLARRAEAAAAAIDNTPEQHETGELRFARFLFFEIDFVRASEGVSAECTGPRKLQQNTFLNTFKRAA